MRFFKIDNALIRLCYEVGRLSYELYYHFIFLYNYKWNTKGQIIPQKGLRQGCHLSPYLCIVRVEAFSNLLIQVERKKNNIRVEIRPAYFHLSPHICK